MRRIIERKVTVVTTTTWTISWQDDPPPSATEADPALSAENLPDSAQPLQTPPPVIETKEADDSSTRKVSYLTANQPPDHFHAHRLKKGNKKS